jgi:hypothetical protein
LFALLHVTRSNSIRAFADAAKGRTSQPRKVRTPSRPLIAGSAGPIGATGPAGPSGPPGPRGPAGPLDPSPSKIPEGAIAAARHVLGGCLITVTLPVQRSRTVISRLCILEQGRARNERRPLHPTKEPQPLQQAPRCGAKTRSGQRCRSPAVVGEEALPDARWRAGIKRTKRGSQRQLQARPLYRRGNRVSAVAQGENS